MTWTYRVVRLPDGSHGLFEVYYDAAGRPEARTAVPVDFVSDPEDGDGAEAIARQLRAALHDATERPVLRDEDIGAGPGVWLRKGGA